MDGGGHEEGMQGPVCRDGLELGTESAARQPLASSRDSADGVDRGVGAGSERDDLSR